MTEVDNVVDFGVIMKQNVQTGTITYWNPNLPGKPQVVLSVDGNRVVTVIKNKRR